MAFHFQGIPVEYTVTGLHADGHLIPGTPILLTWKGRVGLVELQNDTTVDVWYRWESIITDGVDPIPIQHTHGVLKAGSFMSFAMIHGKVSLYTKTACGVDAQLEGSDTDEQDLWVNGYEEE